MHVQPNLRPIIAAAALLGLALTFGSWPVAAQEWTPRQRAACEPDAIRLCHQRIFAVPGRACPITVATLPPPAVPCSTAVRRRRRRDALGERRMEGAAMNEWFIFFVIAWGIFVAASVYYSASELHQIRK